MSVLARIQGLAGRAARRANRWLKPAGRVLKAGQADPPDPGWIAFECNICAARCAVPRTALQRETGRCPACDSSMRHRAVVHHLTLGLFGESLALDRLPPRSASLQGIGMTDSRVYARRLARAFAYRNTFYHREPRLDVRDPAAAYLGIHDFVVCSEVFEHIPPPVGNAFINLRRLLKPGALLVFTAPFITEGDTVEHFPELHDFAIVRRRGTWLLVNRTADGRRQEFPNPVFHGGPGATLEMRLFSESGLRRELERAGFTEIQFHRESCLERGIRWDGPWSVPLTAVAAP